MKAIKSGFAATSLDLFSKGCPAALLGGDWETQLFAAGQGGQLWHQSVTAELERQGHRVF